MNDMHDKVFDAALREATGGVERGPDLAHAVVRASAAERAEALAAVTEADAGGAPTSPFRSILLVAAAVVLGLGVVWAIWSEGKSQDVEDPPIAAGDRQDPERVVPRTTEELRKLLKQVEKVRVRGCYARVSVGEKMVEVDLDRGTAGYVEMSAEDQGAMLGLLNFIAEFPTIPPKKDFKAGARLLMELKDGRQLQVLTELGEAVRVFHDRDIKQAGNEFGNLLAGYMAGSFDRAAVELGVVVAGGLRTQMTTPAGDVFRYPSSLQRLEFYGAPSSALTQDLGRFQDLRELDLTHSASTLDPDEMEIEKWSEESIGALRSVRVFRAPGLSGLKRMKTLVRMTQRMPKLEVVDLRGCDVEVRALFALAQKRTLRSLDITGCRLSRDLGRQLATLTRLAWQPDAVVRIDRMAHWTSEDYGALEAALPCRIEWVAAK